MYFFDGLSETAPVVATNRVAAEEAAPRAYRGYVGLIDSAFVRNVARVRWPLTGQHMKKDSPIHGFVALRACVGFLGQNFKWWPCKFAGPTGVQMLQTMFP